jgi:DNA-directed RNA polymerase subunit alpha
MVSLDLAMPLEDRNNLWTGFQMPRRLATDGESLTERYGRFSAQPFERGFGTTVGNSLRRALLSSIEGAAITAVKIEGVEHEFASIKGVVEDATDIILNLKQVPFKLHSSEPRILRISKEEGGEVTAADIEADADVEILDPSVHIATVLEGGSLKVEMRLKRGRGYVSADRNFDEDLSLGYIPIDSVHTPVKKVNYNVEAARLGQNTEFDKLTIEVWTDGSVTPEECIEMAAQLIKDHMSIFIHAKEHSDHFAYAEFDRPPLRRNDQLDRSVDELELSVRAYTCLKNAGIRTIRDLVLRTEREMLATKNFGRKSLNEIKEILNGMGLDFGMEFDEEGNPIPGSRGRDADVSEFEDQDLSTIDDIHLKTIGTLVGELELKSGSEILRNVREEMFGESTAREYITQRYRALVDRQFLHGLSSEEQGELDRLENILERMEAPFYERVIQRLQKLIQPGEAHFDDARSTLSESNEA